MALTAAQIVNLALQDAKCPAFTSQGGQLLNLILQELAQTYDFDLAKGFTTVTLNNGAGPYNLPADYLRADPDDVWYTINGVPYTLIPVDLSEYDAMVQTPGLANYPTMFATDMSQSPPVMYVWMPPSGAYVVNMRYRRQMADIATPETSSVIPWFPQQMYLRRRLAGELMLITDDERAGSFLGDGEENGQPFGAQALLRRYLKMKDDKADRTASVKMDRRLFGKAFSRLKNTKLVGW